MYRLYIWMLCRVALWTQMVEQTINSEVSHSTLIYTSELLLCSTICVHSATRLNIHMYVLEKARTVTDILTLVLYDCVTWRYSMSLKVLANEDTLLRTHCCPWCFLGCANWEHLLRTQNVSEQYQKHFLCPEHKICVRRTTVARAGKTFVSATMCPQQCVLVCRDLYYTHWYRTIDEQ